MTNDSATEAALPRRTRWAAAGTAVVLLLLLATLRAGIDASDRRLGVGYEMTDGGIELISIAAGGPAERAGLLEGDLLLAIDGQPLHELADFDRVAFGLRRGVKTVVDVMRGEERVQLTIAPGSDYNWRAFALNGVACLAYLAIGLLASGRRADDFRSTLLAAFCFAVAFELALPYTVSMGAGPELAATVLFLLVTGLQFGLDLHLASVLPTAPAWFSSRPWLARLYYTVGLSLSLVAAGAEVGVALGSGELEPLRDLANQVVFDWMLPVWALLVPGLYARQAFRHPDPRGRHQAGLVLLGVLPWTGVVLTDTLRLLIDSDAEPLSPAVWNFALLAYPVAVFVAIYLFRLFDLELVVRKSFLYGSLTTLLILGFYGMVAAIGALFAREFGPEGVPLWVLSVAGLTMGLLFNPLRIRLQGMIDRRLFPERQALRSRLVALAAELPAHGKLPRMGEHLVRELARIFAVESVTVWVSAPPQGQLLQLASTRPTEELERTALLSGEDAAVQMVAHSRRPLLAAPLAQASAAMAQRLAEVGAELVVPLLAQEQLIGLLAFGVKRESQRFVAEELELLTLVGHHVATVFENARLFDSATFEGLTGLYRREALLEILDREWSRAQRHERPLAVALADLDRFKEVNDRYGHLTGDLVLQRIAAELRALLRETDFIGRYGGEEFLMVLPETTLEGARLFAEKVRQRVEQLEIPIEGQESIQITLSIGVASRDEIRADSRVRARALIAAADEALYVAKNNGRNQVEAAVAR